ncbi:hypothetical protein Ccrd_001932 [Cynara cardunculus var. scolymus]|uniref:NADH dehydrogenase [ubiquinone] 1 beta subcomplex subunit 9 n=1 Tax=Cynara cardunculus var. scolymus TaxID=59895 RepID=A0A103XSF8_CYNCS|nr:hypothetical protein Ccrd_001932 [Cynara cardunculus var. scolymus]
MSGAASYLARRAAQKERVRILYRRALKDTLTWAVHRHLFYPDADALRERFDANKNVASQQALLAATQETLAKVVEALVTLNNNKDVASANFSALVPAAAETHISHAHFLSEDIDTIDRMIADGEGQYNKWRHPDPYIVPWAPGGSKFTRNPTPPSGIEIVYDYGREDQS